MPVTTFGKNLKDLVLVGDSYLVNDKDIPEVLQDCVLCYNTQYFFEKSRRNLGFEQPRAKSALWPQ